jgi:large subunit ribosomal protein L6|nr:50S ribosomal protein L6 [Picochlorum sp. 'soloecismus']
MSRHTCYRSIHIPDTVHISYTNGEFHLQGPLGGVSLDIAHMDPKAMVAWRLRTSLEIYAAHPRLAGLWAGRFQSLIHGVIRGYSVTLMVKGIGYRVRIHRNDVYFKLGISHDIIYRIPKGLCGYTPDASTLVLFGVDPAHMNQVAAHIIALRPPSVYQTRGLYRHHRVYPLKVGKRK